jgi:hypothetical protein
MMNTKELDLAHHGQPSNNFDEEEIVFDEVEEYTNDEPCVTSCCLCCNLGLGSILASIGFLVFNGVYIVRQMSSLKSALKDGSSVPELAFHDGHLDAIFAFVGIALAGVAGLAAFVLLFFSCCCGVAEEVAKVKIGAFSWTVATGLCSIWILGEAIYRTVPHEESGSDGLGYIIVTNIAEYETQNPVDQSSKDLVWTWLLAGAYLLFYMYLSVVIMSYVHYLSRSSVMTQKDHLAVKQGMNVTKSDSPALSARSCNTESGLLQRQFSQLGFPPGHPAFMNYGFNGMEGVPGEMAPQYHEMNQTMLPPMFTEQVIMGPQGAPMSVIVDPAGQVVPPEILHQIIAQQPMMGQQPPMMGSECASVITDCTYRSGAPLVQNEFGMPHVERQRSVRFQEHPQTRYIQESNAVGDMNDVMGSDESCEEMSSTSSTSNSTNSTATFDKKKGVRFNLYTEEVETSPYPAEKSADVESDE